MPDYKCCAVRNICKLKITWKYQYSVNSAFTDMTGVSYRQPFSIEKKNRNHISLKSCQHVKIYIFVLNRYSRNIYGAIIYSFELLWLNPWTPYDLFNIGSWLRALCKNFRVIFLSTIKEAKNKILWDSFLRGISDCLLSVLTHCPLTNVAVIYFKGIIFRNFVKNSFNMSSEYCYQVISSWW